MGTATQTEQQPRPHVLFLIGELFFVFLPVDIFACFLYLHYVLLT